MQMSGRDPSRTARIFLTFSSSSSRGVALLVKVLGRMNCSSFVNELWALFSHSSDGISFRCASRIDERAVTSSEPDRLSVVPDIFCLWIDCNCLSVLNK